MRKARTYGTARDSDEEKFEEAALRRTRGSSSDSGPKSWCSPLSGTRGTKENLRLLPPPPGTVEAQGLKRMRRDEESQQLDQDEQARGVGLARLPRHSRSEEV